MEIEVKSQKSQPEADQHWAEKVENTAWLNPDHPNFERWERARELSIERGKYVKSIVEKYIICENLNVLDLGSGEGGTSIIFSERNKVISCDLNLIRLERQRNNFGNYYRINSDALKLPFKKNSFDLIIIQDVIEHLTVTPDLISKIKTVLRNNGIVYISTPNKYSIFNVFADPHWGLPLISILTRKRIKKYFLKNFRKDEINRKDIPQLLSLNDISNNFGYYFEINLETKHSFEKLLKGDKGIIWSDFHINLVKLIKKMRIGNMLLFLTNNKIGIINKYFNPTFYLVMKKIK